MSSNKATVWSLDTPNVSKTKIKRRMEAVKMTGQDLANRLGVGAPVVSRGLDSQTWLQGKIQEIANALSVTPLDLVDQIGHASGTDVLQRVCGPAAETGFRLPVGSDIRVLTIGGKWNVYLLAPQEVPVKDGDFAMIETSAKRGTMVGKINHDENGGHRWIVTPGGNRRPFSVEKSGITCIRLIVSALGGTWGQS